MTRIVRNEFVILRLSFNESSFVKHPLSQSSCKELFKARRLNNFPICAGLSFPQSLSGNPLYAVWMPD